jgi:hypothetical protein
MKPRVIMAAVLNVDEDGMITGVEPSPQDFLFEFREVEVRDLVSLAQAIAMTARNPYCIVVRGKPKQAVGRRANLTVTPRRWVAFDWDDIRSRTTRTRFSTTRQSSRTGRDRRPCSTQSAGSR